MLKFVSQPIFRGAHIQESFIFGEKFVLVGRGLTFFGGGLLFEIFGTLSVLERGDLDLLLAFIDITF